MIATSHAHVGSTIQLFGSRAISSLPQTDAGQNSSPHPRTHYGKLVVDGQFMPHAVYTAEELKAVATTHLAPKTLADKAALGLVKFARFSFDWFSGYSALKAANKPVTADVYFMRFIVLETVAGIPGMVGGMIRHLHSLRLMRRDNGWIHTLLEEAENERMHLLTFLQIRQASPFIRYLVVAAQGVMFNLYFLAYLISPRTCHRFVGFLEEEAVHTYSVVLEDIERGSLQEWRRMPAPDIALKYWRLSPGSTFEDVIKNIRADEMVHRDVNHGLADVGPSAPNPWSSTTGISSKQSSESSHPLH